MRLFDFNGDFKMIWTKVAKQAQPQNGRDWFMVMLGADFLRKELGVSRLDAINTANKISDILTEGFNRAKNNQHGNQ